jgi:soluble lytic murein transglycosylase
VSPSGATVQTRRNRARRPPAARRRAAARRRRWLLAVLLVAFAVVAVVVLMPLARKAANEFGLPLQYQSVIRQQAAEKRLDPALIAAVIYAETKFDPRTSSAGALGLMQILPQTAEFLARRTGARTFTTADLATPQVNIAYGSYYLRFLLDQYRGSTLLALAAYNGGEANVDDWVAAARARGTPFTSADIRFSETRAYVDRVLNAQRDYRHTYASQLGYT